MFKPIHLKMYHFDNHYYKRLISYSTLYFLHWDFEIFSPLYQQNISIWISHMSNDTSSIAMLDSTGLNYGQQSPGPYSQGTAGLIHSWMKTRVWQQQEHTHCTAFQLLLISESYSKWWFRQILPKWVPLSVLLEAQSPSRGNPAATEPRQCRSKLKKAVAGWGAAVKEVTSFQQRPSNLSSLGYAAENFLLSAGNGRISELS